MLRRDLINRLKDSEINMRRLQTELNQIVRDIKASPDRFLNTDQEAKLKNEEVSDAILAYLSLKKQVCEYDNQEW